MTDRNRDPLPDGYQFGDAGCSHPVAVWNKADTAVCMSCGAVVSMDGREMIGLSMASRPKHWNTIEVDEPFASDAERHPVTEGFIAIEQDPWAVMIVDRDPGDETTK